MARAHACSNTFLGKGDGKSVKGAWVIFDINQHQYNIFNIEMIHLQDYVGYLNIIFVF